MDKKESKPTITFGKLKKDNKPKSTWTRFLAKVSVLKALALNLAVSTGCALGGHSVLVIVLLKAQYILMFSSAYMPK